MTDDTIKLNFTEKPLDYFYEFKFAGKVIAEFISGDERPHEVIIRFTDGTQLILTAMAERGEAFIYLSAKI